MRIAALKTHWLAMLIAGLACLSFVSGQVTKTPAPESLESLRSRADKGDAEAQLTLGFRYSAGLGVPQDDAEALRWTRKAAEQGNAQAQANLGYMYYEGEGVPQDYVEAYRWYRRAAEQGNTGAQSHIGLMYDSGQGVPQNHVEALGWYRKAAELGDPEGQAQLGVRYSAGQGVPQDYVQAHMWLNLAAARGIAEKNEKLRDALALKMTPSQVAQAQRLARDWTPKTGQAFVAQHVKAERAQAEQGEAKAQYSLGFSYATGIGVPQDYVQAHMWLNLATSRAAGEDREKYAKVRDALADEMTAAQIAEAQRLAREWKPKTSEDLKRQDKK